MTRTRTHARAAQPSRNGRHTPHANANGKAGRHTAPPSADGVNGTPSAGKDPSTGRFLPGNKLGKGNPHYRKLAENRSAALAAVSPEQIGQLFRKWFELALAGDGHAMRLICDYCIGRPVEVVDADAADLDELRRAMRQPLDVELLLHGANGVSVAEALAFLKGVAAAKKPGAWLGTDNDDDDDEGGEGGKLPVLARLREKTLQARAGKS
jgi:hypothetical protein